jgi:predicted phage terminase large subunit-like protein
MQAMLIGFSAKHPDVVTKLVEDKAAGKPIVQSLRHIVSGLIEWKVGGGTGGKLARAEAWTGLAEAGNIWLPHPTEARINGRPHPCPWVHDWIERVCAFSGLDNDVADEVDTASQALAYLRDQGGYAQDLETAMRRLRMEGVL